MTAPVSPHPPHPGLALRVGVTGHRPNRENFASDRLAEVLGTCLCQIKNALEDALDADRQRDGARVFAAEPVRAKLICALAEGTDTIAAQSALAHGFELHVPLPFSRDETAHDYGPVEERTYRALLDQASAVFELPGSREREAASYEAVGLITARQSDLMIVVWDKEHSQGRGGTFDILNRALNAGIPALWFLPNGDGPFLLAADPAATVDPRDLIVRAQHNGRLDEIAVKTLVTALVAPPENEDGCAHTRLADFFQETERRFPDQIYGWMLRLLGMASPWRPGPLPRYFALARESWAPFDQAMTEAGLHMPPAHQAVLKPRYAWAEGLAAYYGAQARAAPLRRHGLTALAVAFAIGLVLLPEWDGWDRLLQPLFMAGEILAVLGIIVSGLKSRRERWQERWFDYRLLAEELRQLRFLSLSGSRSLEAQVPPPDIDRQPGPRWVNWYYRATVRELPLPHVSMDQTYLDNIASVMRHGEIRSQIERFRARARKLDHLGARLEWLARAAFMATLVAGLTYLVLFIARDRDALIDPLADYAMRTIILLAALLPTIGAGLTALARHDGIENARDRARATADRLERLWRSNGSHPSLSRVSNLTEDVARIMMTDITDWRLVHRSKPLSLPSPDGGDIPILRPLGQ